MAQKYARISVDTMYNFKCLPKIFITKILIYNIFKIFLSN